MAGGAYVAAGYVPGTSPFKFKGTGYRSQLDFLDHHVPGGSAAVVARIAHAPTRAFFAQKFLSGGWYDALPTAAIAESAAVLAGVTHSEMCRRFGRWAAQRDIPGVYRFLLKLASPDGLVRRFPKSSRLYFNFAELDVSEVRPRVYEILHHGIPAPIQPVYQFAVEAFRVTALESAGARNVRARWFPAIACAPREGIDIVQLRCELAWD